MVSQFHRGPSSIIATVGSVVAEASGSTVAFARVEGGNRTTTESQPLVTGLTEEQANALYAEGIDVAIAALNGLDYEVPHELVPGGPPSFTSPFPTFFSRTASRDRAKWNTPCRVCFAEPTRVSRS